jgi:hypothetical protein
MRNKETQEYIDMIEEMLLDDNYSFAEDFMQSVLRQAKIKDFISEKQKQAIDNVRESITDREGGRR